MVMGGKGTHRPGRPGRSQTSARSPRTRFLTLEELGCWLPQHRNHQVTALSQEEILDETRCRQLKQTTSCWLVGHGRDETLGLIHSKSGSNLMLRQKGSII